jgi:uncharacterized protein
MPAEAWQMICPKCGAAMGTVDKCGVHIERCLACQGIFLDHGELDRVIAAETSFHAQPPPYRDHVHQDDSHGRRAGYPDSRHDRYSGHHKRRGTSFFEELFD